MYLYQITNLNNQKIYIGQTNNIIKRWSNHRCCNNPNMVIAKAIKKYGVENFKFEILFSNISIEDIDELEQKIIKEKNCLVPNGYNVSKGGQAFHNFEIKYYGEENSNAHLTKEEAQYLLDHRDIPEYILYDLYNEKLSYGAFKNIYNGITYTNLKTSTQIYPYNTEFSNQFTSGNKLDYDQVVNLRIRYANGEYWKNVYQDFKHIYDNEWSFWNVYYGNRYKLVMPEVFTEENRKKHSKLGKSGENNGRSKLILEDVINIREKWKNGSTRQELYNLYPSVSQTTIRNVINNKTWKNIL